MFIEIKKDCRWLMLSLFALILLIPLIQQGRSGTLLLKILSTLIFISAVRAVNDDRRYRVWAICLIIPPILVEWVNQTRGLEPLSLLLLPSLYHLPPYMLISYLMMKYIFKGSRLTPDHLFAAISLFLLLGLFWSHLYMIVHALYPDSFSLSAGAGSQKAHLFAELLYFSYVTLTTLGYGDVVPLSLHAKSLAITEAIVGVLFIGALIGRIAGSMILHGEVDGRQDG